MNQLDAYSMCQRYVKQYARVKTADGHTYSGYIGNVDEDKVYVAVPDDDYREVDSSDARSYGCCGRRRRYHGYPAYYPPYYPVSPTYYGPRPGYPYPPPVYPIRRRGWRWIAIPLAFLAGVWVGKIID